MSQTPVVVMPEWVPPPQREAWLVAGGLQRAVPEGWTVVGGQMVQFHGWRAGTVPTRTTTDLDAGIAARAHPDAFRALSAAAQELGLRPVLHPSGIEHRWFRTLEDGSRVQVDLLLPSGLGARAGRSVNERPGVQSRGVQWATDLSRVWRLKVGGEAFEVPVPSLLGAVVAKASALLNASDHDPERHLSDLVFLAGVAAREDLAESLTVRQAQRVLEAIERIRRPGVSIARLSMAVRRNLDQLR